MVMATTRLSLERPTGQPPNQRYESHRGKIAQRSLKKPQLTRESRSFTLIDLALERIIVALSKENQCPTNINTCSQQELFCCVCFYHYH